MLEESVDLLDKTGTDHIRAFADRIEGYVRLQVGDTAGAMEKFDHSQSLAAASDAAYELALTLRAEARLVEARGGDASGLLAQADEILEKKFKEALKRADKSEAPPPRIFDLD